MKTKELTAELSQLLAEHGYSEKYGQIHAGNAKSMVFDILKWSHQANNPAFFQALVDLNAKARHTADHSYKYIALANKAYEKVTRPVNLQLHEIMKKYMPKTHFEREPSAILNDDPWVEHCNSVYVDGDKSRIQALMGEIEPFVDFGDMVEDIMGKGRGYAVAYELKAWKQAEQQLNEDFAIQVEGMEITTDTDFKEGQTVEFATWSPAKGHYWETATYHTQHPVYGNEPYIRLKSGVMMVLAHNNLNLHKSGTVIGFISTHGTV
nr:hypothetical protein [uncultured Arsenicibacter sp.]